MNLRLILPLIPTVVIAIAFTSCGRKTVSGNSQVLTDIKIQSGIALSTNTQVLKAGDANSRESGYYEWTAYLKAPEQIQIPHTPNSTSSIEENRGPDETAIKVVEAAIGTHIKNPVGTIFSIWDTPTLQCQGTLVRTADGDYLYLRRFSRPLSASNTNGFK